MAVEVRIPELGESVTEGVIARWLKQDGELVQADESVLELETEKATLEIPATASGRLEIVERKGATVRVGTVVARIAQGADRPTASAKPKTAPARAKPPAPAPASPPDSGTRSQPPVEPDAEDNEPQHHDDQAGMLERAARDGETPPEPKPPKPGTTWSVRSPKWRRTGWNRRQRNRRPPPRKSNPLPPRGGHARCRPRSPRRPMRSSGSR